MLRKDNILSDKYLKKIIIIDVYEKWYLIIWIFYAQFILKRVFNYCSLVKIFLLTDGCKMELIKIFKINLFYIHFIIRKINTYNLFVNKIT